MKSETMEYIGTYKVIKFFRKSNRRQIIRRGLTLDEAKRLVNCFPNRKTSLVGFTKQFSSEKYFKKIN